MANVMRWRYGETEPVMCAVDSTQTVDIGDLCWLNTDDARPADAHAWTGLNASQEAFVDNFIGVAMQQSRSGDTDDIRIATAGVFEFACAAATFEVHDMVGPDDNTAASALLSQQVIAVTDAARAIGKVAKRYSSNTTSVLVRIIGQMRGGLQAGISSAS